MTDCDWPIGSQMQTTSKTSKIFGEKKYQISPLKITHFHAVDGCETLEIHLHNPSLLTCKISGKLQIWLNIWLESF